jgi:hypothetical protein
MGQRLRRPVGLLPGISGVILAAALFAPAAARGECGGYVTYTDPAHAGPMSDHGPVPVGCHGPNCSQTPAPAPMPEPPPHLRILTDDSLPVTGGESDSARDSSSLPFDPAGGTPIRRAADVYHPPR